MNRDEQPSVWGRFEPVLPRLLLPPALLVALHGVISLGFDGYTHFPPLDIPMHFVGGVVITLSGALALRVVLEGGWIRGLHPLPAACILFCFATTAAVVWEFVEFLADHFLRAGAQGSIEDTLGDLVVGMAGALPAALWASRRLPRDDA